MNENMNPNAGNNAGNGSRARAMRRPNVNPAAADSKGGSVRTQGESSPVRNGGNVSRRPAPSKRTGAAPGMTPPRQNDAARTSSPASGTPRKSSAHRKNGGLSSLFGKRRKGDPRPTGKPENTAVSSLVKTIIYISVVLVTSGFLSYFGITAGNDVFAFVKPDNAVEITTDEGITIAKLADTLHDEGVIRYPGVFKLYAKLRKKGDGLIATTQTVSSNMSYDALIAAFKPQKKEREQVKVTIPEGYTVDDIIKLFVEDNGIGTKEGFVTAINEAEYDYWFIPDEKTFRDGRTYRLEGYLYPDTYYVYTDSSETTIVNKLLSNFEKKFDSRYKEKAEELGWSIDDVLILASMIQKEAKYETEYDKVSSVFRNRLGNTGVTGGKLESDATIEYVLEERVDKITNEELKIDSPYNTYLYAGLPPGPICNPTSYAINYALYPAETDYYYFVARPNGYSLFARTYAEHLNNVAAVEKESAENG